MKNNVPTTLILVTLVFLLGCKQEQGETETFTRFPATDSLQSVQPDVEAYFRGARLSIYDSLLILETMYAENKLHIYNKNAFEHIATSGVTGKGPGEIRNPFGASLDKENGVIWYSDLGSRKIWEFELEGILSDSGYRPDQYAEYPSGPRFFKSIKPFRDGLFVYPTDERQNYLMVFNAEGEVVDSVPNKTDLYPDLDPGKIMSTSWYRYTIHPSKERILFAYHNADILVCTDFEGNVIWAQQGPDMIMEEPEKTSVQKDLETGRKNTYSKILSDEKYVYCLYSGRRSWVKEEGQPKPQFAYQLFVFTWEGDPVIRLKLDYPTPAFVLDRENNRIITYPWDVGNIIYYDFDFDRLDEIG